MNEQTDAGAIPVQHPVEVQFARRLEKAGWYTYRDEATGRVVTNAHECELMQLQKISGLRCEVVSPSPTPGCCARIGPTLVTPNAKFTGPREHNRSDQ